MNLAVWIAIFVAIFAGLIPVFIAAANRKKDD